MSQPVVASASWKWHPIYFVGLGFFLGVGFAMKWLAPAHQGNLRYELIDAKRAQQQAVAELKAEVEKRVEQQKLVARLEREAIKLRQDLLDAQTSWLFIEGSPYPVGLAEIRVGDPATKIGEIYSEQKIERDENIVRVSLDHAVFDRVSVWLTQVDKEYRVRAVDFQLKSDLWHHDAGYLGRKLAEVLGAPESERRGMRFWPAKNGVVVRTSALGYSIEQETTYSLQRSRKLETGTVR